MLFSLVKCLGQCNKCAARILQSESFCNINFIFFLNNNESVPIELNLLSSVKGYMDFSSFLRTTITCITCRKIENKDLKIVFHNSTISTENVLLNIW